jgi:hypothetical protein
VQPGLRPLDEDLWLAERRFAPLPVRDIGTRMTVVRLPGGDVVLHSPTAADEPTRLAVEAIGPVRAVICPNRVHPHFAGEWKHADPAALLLAAPGLAAERRELAFDGVLERVCAWL